MSSNRPEGIFVSPSIIREAFNSGQFWERALRGEFYTRLEHDTHYTPEQAREKGFRYCSRSQAVRYYNDVHELIAVVHQVRSPDGTLGASGLPDPKYLDLGDQILKTRT